MASTSTVPSKSHQPLHNFSSLSHLKWSRHPRNHRSSATTRRSSSPNQQDSPQRQSPLRNLLPDESITNQNQLSLPSPSPITGGYCEGSLSPLPRSSYSPVLPGPGNESPIPVDLALESDSSLIIKKSQIDFNKQSRNSVPNRSITPDKSEDQEEEPILGKKESKSSRVVLIKLPPKEKKDSGEIKIQDEQTTDNNEIQEDGKTWNFRPRKQNKQFFNYSGRVSKNSAAPLPEKPGDMPEAEKKKKEKKRGFTISLTKEEIEADVIALIGSKPPRRPKKRSRTVQKQLDYLFPGVWLQSITADSYKVSDNLGGKG
ncbi:hypothetical protein M9H77_33477 [Catharanthus roseus]|uniref:Uncharacterized protein n=1 Tax=Catharanthus roseus TaxID=4058 RepID=A0ACB9ZKN4_CATRO|nr:hypothetical protein M9H77_33477 [Catharanthus roseus]